MSLSKIQSLRIAAVLEDCSNQLNILGHALSVQISRERSLEPAQDKSKLVRDCQWISQQMSSLHFELQQKQSFSSFLQVVEEKEQKKNNKEKKRELDIELKQRRLNLLRQQQELHDKSEELDRLSSYCVHLRDMTALKKTTMQERSEQEPVQKKSSEAENQLEDELEFLQKKMEEERRVHEESENFLKNKQKELQQVLQNWQQSTKQMLQEKEDQLNNTSCKRTLNLDRMMEMKRKLTVMEQVVMEDQEEQEQLRQLQAKITAVTRLQAWWRCCMVRRCLGPFKKAVESKAGKKKKGKKKK